MLVGTWWHGCREPKLRAAKENPPQWKVDSQDGGGGDKARSANRVCAKNRIGGKRFWKTPREGASGKRAGGEEWCDSTRSKGGSGR